MTPTLIRAARAGLGWTQDQLATAANIHPKSVAYWERQAATPQESHHAPKGAVPRIEAAFQRAGVQISGGAISFPE